MSSGSFLTGVAAAVILAVPASAAASDDRGSPGRHGSHEVAASAYGASFMATGAYCSAYGAAATATVSLHGNPFGAFGGSRAYSSFFFNGSGSSGASVTSAGQGSAGASALMSMPSSGRPNGNVPNLPILGNSTAVTVTHSNNASTAAAGSNTLATQGSVKIQALPVAATPEPATLFLLTTGLGGAVIANRRRNRRSK